MARFDGVLRISVKNWGEFQHYKDRNPHWIKLHKRILDDYDFQCLPVASRALAPMIWLLASEYRGGIIVATLAAIAFRIRQSATDVESALIPLIDKGFLILDQDASNALAECKQEASLEKRREETYTPEKEGNETTPEGLHEREYAIRILDDLGLPAKPNLITVADSIAAYSRKNQVSKAQAFEFIRRRALDDQAAGKLDGFWFRDGKYNPEVKPVTESKYAGFAPR